MQKKEGKKLALTAIFMIAATVLAKALGLLRDMLLADRFGTNAEAAAYTAASRLPINLFDFALGGVVTAAFIPLFNELYVKRGKEEAFRFANRYFNLILCITTGITAVGILASRPLIGFLAPGLAPEARELAISLSRLMFPMMIFTGIAYCFVGILQSFEHYTLPALMSLVSNLVMVVYFYTLCHRFGVWGLSAALVLGWFLQAAIQAPSAHKLGFCYRPTLAFGDENIRRALTMALPILVCSWLQPVCNIINTRFASGFAEGRAVAAVEYANRLYIMLVGIFSFVATNLLFPRLSRAEATGDEKGARAFAGISVKLLLYIMLPLAAGIYLVADPLIEVVYLRGEFTAEDAAMTASVLKMFALGIPFLSANEVLTKLFFAKQKVRAPMLSSLISIAANIGLVTLLTNTIGLSGVGLASSLTVALCAILNLILLSRDGAILRPSDLPDLCKALLATAGMIAAVLALGTPTEPSALPDLFRLLFAGGVGVIVYGILFLLLSPSEIKTLFQRGKHD